MVNIDKLRNEQIKLSKKVVINDNIKSIKTIAGVDQAYFGDKIVSAIAICDYKSFDIIEKKYAIADVKINYISGYLFYREGPAVIEAYNKLEQKPDVLLVKGNGILHPRRFGIACHLGVLLDVATIGVAKNLMLGDLKEKTIYVEKEARGYELVTREHARPVYISPGHNISLKTSMEVIRKCIKYPHKMPEPLHLAHKYMNSIKKQFMSKEF